MSVGVCVINRNGIALAADSAGTYDVNNDPKKRMFYNTVNKLFSLSSKSLCAAITYGRLSLCNVSIEQIVCEFGRYLDTVDEIGDFFDIITRFERYIELNNQYYGFGEEEDKYCKGVIINILQEWNENTKGLVNKEDRNIEIDRLLREKKDEVEKWNKIDEFDIKQYINQQYRSYYDKIVISNVPAFKELSSEIELLWELITFYFRAILKVEEQKEAGLLFAGYGTEDAYPKYVQLSLYNVIGGRLKYSVSEKYYCGRLGGKIKPVAQPDVILTFCQGISGSMIGEISSGYTKIINDLLSSYTGIGKNEIKEHFKDFKQSFDNTISQIVQKEVRSTLDIMATLPISEMAFLSENLVNITELKRTYAIDGNQQTVGGPIDVAIITKGSGFEWIRKKRFQKGP